MIAGKILLYPAFTKGETKRYWIATAPERRFAKTHLFLSSSIGGHEEIENVVTLLFLPYRQNGGEEKPSKQSCQRVCAVW